MDLFVKLWGVGVKLDGKYDGGPQEANFLKLDCSKLKNTFKLKTQLHLYKAIEKILEWSKCWFKGDDVRAFIDKEIGGFEHS